MIDDKELYDELLKECKLNDIFTSLVFFFTVLVQATFVTKYWVIGKTMQLFKLNETDANLEMKAYGIFSTIMFFTLVGLSVVIGLQCESEATTLSEISFAIEMLTQAELMLVLADALRVMKGSEQSLSPKMLIVLLCTGFSFLTSEIIESVLLWSVGLS